MLRHSSATLEGSNILWHIVAPPLPPSTPLLCFSLFITPLKVIKFLNEVCVWGNSLYEKLLDHLGKREKLDLGLTNYFFTVAVPIHADFIFYGESRFSLCRKLFMFNCAVLYCIAVGTRSQDILDCTIIERSDWCKLSDCTAIQYREYGIWILGTSLVMERAQVQAVWGSVYWCTSQKMNQMLTLVPFI